MLDHSIIAVRCDDVGVRLIFVDCEMFPTTKDAALIGGEELDSVDDSRDVAASSF